MEKAFTEREFQTNHNVRFETVKVSFVFKYSIESLEFSGAAKQIIICVKFKQTPGKTTAK